MTDSYLGPIYSQDRNIAEIQARADKVERRGEFEVVLQYESVVGARFVPKQVVPDATLTTASQRFFLEIDRSTESGKRIRRVLTSYKSAFEHTSYSSLFESALAPSILYITKSRARASRLQSIVEELAMPFPVHALGMRAALKFLNASVGGETTAPIREEEVARRHLNKLYSVCREYVAECSSDVQHSPLGRTLHEVYEYLVAHPVRQQ